MLQQIRGDKKGTMTLHGYFAFAVFHIWTFVLGVFWEGVWEGMLFCFYCGPYKRSETSYSFFLSLPYSWFAHKSCYFTMSKTWDLLIISPYFLLKCTFDLLRTISEPCLVTRDFFFKLPVILHEVLCLHSEALMHLLSSGCHSLKILSTVKFISRILDECAGVGRGGLIVFIRKDFSLRKSKRIEALIGKSPLL